VARVPSPRTGAERYLTDRLADPAYREHFESARERIEQIDTIVRALDDRRAELGLTKAELARRAGVKPEAVRRLFSIEHPNPTLKTIVSLATVLDLRVEPTVRPPTATPAPSVEPGTRRRSA
jgi:DNA-binding XRE family transcriptional regulator